MKPGVDGHNDHDREAVRPGLDSPDDREMAAHILMPSVPSPAPSPGPSVGSIWDYTGLPAKVVKSYGSLPLGLYQVWLCHDF